MTELDKAKVVRNPSDNWVLSPKGSCNVVSKEIDQFLNTSGDTFVIGRFL